jgi:hypothetical protein
MLQICCKYYYGDHFPSLLLELVNTNRIILLLVVVVVALFALFALLMIVVVVVVVSVVVVVDFCMDPQQALNSLALSQRVLGVAVEVRSIEVVKKKAAMRC